MRCGTGKGQVAGCGVAPTKVIYFSDSTVAQYKHIKPFIIIFYHEQDFGLSPEWNFFTRSHGKGLADGERETVKWLAAKASLQRVYNNKIKTLHELFNYCSSNKHNIKFFVYEKKKYLTIKGNLLWQLQHQKLKLINFNVITSIQNFIQIHQLVQKL
jgi:hypothetical protein